MTINHWHVTRHSDDEDPCVTETIFAALDYARTELDSLADFEHDGASFTAHRVEEARTMGGKYPSTYEMEEALLSFAKVERYTGLMANAANIVKQNGTFYADRAPLYQVDSADWVGRVGNELADARDAADARLYESALHTAREINENSPLGIWDCTAELRTWPEEDQMHGGESYCADEYPDGYAGDVDSDPTGRDEPAGDH